VLSFPQEQKGRKEKERGKEQHTKEKIELFFARSLTYITSLLYDYCGKD
jgi:hypothetical protein